MSLEIERKFLIKPLNIDKHLKQHDLKFTRTEIEQHYIQNSDGEPLRLRKYGDKFILTVKKGEGVVREEFEEEITQERFRDTLNDAEEIRTLYKTRYKVQINKHLYEIDEFHNGLEGLFYLEVEFENIQKANSFKLDKTFKKFIIDEVSEKRGFSNYALASSQTVPSFTPCKDIRSIDTLLPSVSLSCATKVIISSLVTEIKTYAKQILRDTDAIESLHQLRIRLRQITVVFKEFQNIYDRLWLQEITTQIKKILKQTNAKRDIDVFIGHYEGYLTHLPPSMQKDIYPLETFLLKEQTKKQQELLELLQSESFQKALVSVQRPIFTKYAKSILIVELYKVMDKKLKRVFSAVHKLNKHTPDKVFHKLRINFKELRYTISFFRHFYPHESKHFISFTKDAQSMLGDYQDIVVQSHYIKKQLSKGKFPLETTLACGKLIADLEFETIKMRQRLGHQWKKEFHKVLKIL